jgi:multiple sugar transport system substrate-binding protein
MVKFVLPICLLTAAACTSDPRGKTIVFPVSSVGAEADVLRAQIARFEEERPDIRVVLRETPDSADQRHQLYVQWLAAGAGDPDVLQLDVIWTPEFASAGWILPLGAFEIDETVFFPGTLRANRWRGELYAIPWFVDVGMLYWRTDKLDAPPATLEELEQRAVAAKRRGEVEHGLVWQGARYEGLVCVFLEHLGAFGGRILDEKGRPAVDTEPGRQALEFLRRSIGEDGFVPRAVLTWQEEQTRFAFQSGRALFLRNWPYAYPLLQDPEESEVAGKFAVAPFPGTANGAPTAALGGSQLAINARSRHPEAAFALIEYLISPERMLERARAAGQLPPRRDLYDDPSLAAELAEALPIPPDEARRVVEAAVPRPVTPVYTELSSVLQVWLHRALSGEVGTDEALREATDAMTDVLDRTTARRDAS